jgi:hypothetical protein
MDKPQNGVTKGLTEPYADTRVSRGVGWDEMYHTYIKQALTAPEHKKILLVLVNVRPYKEKKI